MIIRQFIDNDIDEVINLFNKHCGEDLLHKPLTKESFSKKFVENIHFSYDLTFVAVVDNKIVGFGNGLYKKQFLPNENKELSPGFITMILVDKDYRRKKIGTQLLLKIEEKLKQQNKKRLDCSFFNPVNFEWFIPNTNNHEHPNTPGVRENSPAHYFFLKHNYKAVAKQNSYYLDLAKFELPQYIIDKIAELKEKEIIIKYFDASCHFGFEELFDKLGNEGWRYEIMNAAYGENKKPVLIPVHNNKIVGFTGPLGVQESGRGYFAGIGIHPDYRHYGAGKTLFFMLCENLKKLGAGYMTLFTGEENPARRMYEAAGFAIVQSWYVMRKEL